MPCTQGSQMNSPRPVPRQISTTPRSLGYLPVPRPIDAKHEVLGSAPKHSQKKS